MASSALSVLSLSQAAQSSSEICLELFWLVHLDDLDLQSLCGFTGVRLFLSSADQEKKKCDIPTWR